MLSRTRNHSKGSPYLMQVVPMTLTRAIIFFKIFILALTLTMLSADSDGILVPQEVLLGSTYLQGVTKFHAIGPKDSYMNI